MSHYSDDQFSLEGAYPDFLPARIRLPDNTTVSPEYVTLEQLNELGYVGPISIPVINPQTQYLVWHSDTYTFEIKTKTGPDIELDQAVRNYLNDTISFYEQQNIDPFTFTYITEKKKYILQLQKLVASSRVLTFADVPSFIPSYPQTLAQAQETCDNWIKNGAALSSGVPYGKFYYEKLGFVVGLEEKFRPYFVPPSGWQQSILPNFRFAIWYEYPDTQPTVSGYLLPSGENWYNENADSPISLIIRSDYFYTL